MTQFRLENSRQARHAERSEEILQCAIAVFNRAGVRGATLAEIAAPVGLNLTSLRHYYRHKDDLIAAAFNRSIDTLLELIDAAAASTPEQRTENLVTRFFALRQRVRLGEAPDMMHFGDMRALSGRQAEEIWRRFTDLFRALRALAATPEDILTERRMTNARAHMLFGQIVRAAFWLDSMAPEDFPRAARHVVDILAKGLSAPEVVWRPRLAGLIETPPPERRSPDSFLIAATELINRQGYGGASVDAIAGSLNVTKGSFYHHLEGKDDLIAACFERSHAIVAGAQRAAIAQEARGLDQAIASVSALAHRQLSGVGPLLRASALSSVEPASRVKMLRRADGLAHRFADMVADGVIDGGARVCDPRIAGQMLLSHVNSMEELMHWAPGVDAGNVVDIYVRPIFHGMFARTPTA